MKIEMTLYWEWGREWWKIKRRANFKIVSKTNSLEIPQNETRILEKLANYSLIATVISIWTFFCILNDDEFKYGQRNYIEMFKEFSFESEPVVSVQRSFFHFLIELSLEPCYWILFFEKKG